MNRINMVKLLWTKEKEELLRQLFPRASQEELQRAFPEISWVIIKRKANSLGIRRDLSYIHKNFKKQREGKWTREEETLLKEKFELAPRKELEALFPSRTWVAIKSRGAMLGLKRNREMAYKTRPHTRDDVWSVEEDLLLQDAYKKVEFKKDLYDIFKEIYPERTKSAIDSRIKIKNYYSLRSSSPKSRHFWSDDEKKYLKENFANSDWSTLEKKLNRPRKTIQFMAYKLGYNRNVDLHEKDSWSAYELTLLRSLWPEASIEVILSKINRTYESLKKKAHELQIKRIIHSSTSETIFKRIIKDVLGEHEYFENIRPSWLRSSTTGYPIELDIYFPLLNLAFEYNGAQHYCFESFKGIMRAKKLDLSEEEMKILFNRYQQNDQDKKIICQERKIRLICIDYDEDFDEEILKRLLVEKD